MLNRIRSSLQLNWRPKSDDEDPPQEEPKRRPNKLSKPPTIRSSNSLLTRRAFEDVEESEIPIAELSPVSPLAEIVNESAGERRSRQDARQSLKTELFSPKVEEAYIIPEDDAYNWNGSRANLLGPAKSQRRQSDRSSTLFLLKPDRPSAPPRRFSAITSSEIAKHLPMEEALGDEPLKLSSGDLMSAADLSTPERNVRRRSSGAMCMPMRRRSLQTPGVATRISKESLSAMEDSQHDCYRTSFDKEGTPSVIEEHTEVATPELEPSELSYYTAQPSSRAVTPSDLEYPNLGGLRSLRVTNGRPSPTPSDVTSLTSRIPSSSNGVTNRTTSANTIDTISTTRLSSDGSNTTNCGGTARPVQIRKPQEVLLSSSKTAQSTIVTIDNHGSTTHVSVHVPQTSSVVTTTVTNGKRIDVSNSSRSITSDDLLEDHKSLTSDASYVAQQYVDEIANSSSYFLRPTSPNQPGLNTTSKATEFDDKLFEEEPADVDLSETAGYFDERDGAEVLQTRIRGCGDSGYNSGVSARTSAEDASTSEENSPLTSTNTTPMEENMPHEAELEARLEGLSTSKKGNRQSFLPSILRQKFATTDVVPRISDFTHSTNSWGTFESSQSDCSVEAAPQKKLKKRRDNAQPAVTVQGYRELAQAHIPPVPSEIAANLAKRQQQFSELNHTFKTLHHTRSFESNTTLSCLNKTQYEFPTPVDDDDPSEKPAKNRRSYGLTETISRRPSIRNIVPFRRTKSDQEPTQSSLPGEVDRATALAIIQSAQGHAFNPYNYVQPQPPATRSMSLTHESYELPGSFPPGENRRDLRQQPHRRETQKFADEGEAIAFARHRSEAKQRAKEHDRYTVTPKVNTKHSFNDRGGVPGKNPSPRVTDKMDVPPVPPVPPIPADVKTKPIEKQRKSGDSSVLNTSFTELPSTNESNGVSDAEPQPSSSAGNRNEAEDEPKINGMAQEEQEIKDSWQPYLEAWRTRRQAAAVSKEPSNASSAVSSVPARASSSAPSSASTCRPSSTPSPDQYLRPPPPKHRSRSSSYASKRSEGSKVGGFPAFTQGSIFNSPSSAFVPPRRPASSTNLPTPANSLTPSLLDPSEVPYIGRYSGGLSYGFESRVSLGGGDANCKGQRLSQDFGLDLSDVPLMIGVKQA